MTNLISDAFIQAKELVMKAMGELVADGTFPAEPVPAFNTETVSYTHLTLPTVTFPLMPQWYVQDLSETIQEK